MYFHHRCPGRRRGPTSSGSPRVVSWSTVVSHVLRPPSITTPSKVAAMAVAVSIGLSAIVGGGVDVEGGAVSAGGCVDEMVDIGGKVEGGKVERAAVELGTSGDVVVSISSVANAAVVVTALGGEPALSAVDGSCDDWGPSEVQELSAPAKSATESSGTRTIHCMFPPTSTSITAAEQILTHWAAVCPVPADVERGPIDTFHHVIFAGGASRRQVNGTQRDWTNGHG